MHLDGCFESDLGYSYPFSSVSPSDAAMAVCCPSPLNSPHAFEPTPTAISSGAGDFFQFPPSAKQVADWQQQQPHQTVLHDLSGAGGPTAPPPTSSSSLPSPMAISPALSTLNTPRGSITDSVRHESPMHTEPASTALHGHFLPHHPVLREVAASPSASSFADTQQQPSLACLDEYLASASYPSPPGSRYSSPVHGQSSSSSSYPTHPPPSYEQHMTYHHHQQQQQHTETSYLAPAAAEDQSMSYVLSSDLPLFAISTKQEPDFSEAASPALVQGLAPTSHPHVTSTTPDLLSDACPETPDSSVRDVGAAASTELKAAEPPLVDSGSYVCLWQDCGAEVDTQRQLVEHVQEAHVEASGKKGCEDRPCLWRNCPRNLKPFNAKYKLSTHMRVHTKEKPYKCEFEGCLRAFARLENRKIHMRSHTGHKPFPCKYAEEFGCNKRFSNSSDRAKHEQTHKDPKPYRCEVLGCPKRYTDPSSLRKHVKSHTTEEQQQYRRAKDQINAQKAQQLQLRAGETPWPTATLQAEEASAAAAEEAVPAGGGAARAAGHETSTLAASTLLAVGLQAGGTMVDLGAAASASPQGMAIDPLQMQATDGDDSRQQPCFAQFFAPAGPGGDDKGDARRDDPMMTMATPSRAGPADGGHTNDGLQARTDKRDPEAHGTAPAGSGLPLLLSHQPNSLDDLDPSDGHLPFDDVPVRYDTDQTQ